MLLQWWFHSGLKNTGVVVTMQLAQWMPFTIDENGILDKNVI